MDDRYDRWQSKIDRAIEELLKDTADLPGAGKPLKLDQDPHAPSDQRIANKIMKDHNVLPEWIMLNKELEARHAALMDQIRRAWTRHQQALRAAQTPQATQNALDTWQGVQARLADAIQQYNDRALTYNLKVPPGVSHRRLLRLHIELERVANT